MSARRPGRWLIAGGLVGLAFSPAARRAGVGLRARASAVGRRRADPVAPFREAPCYAREGARSADGAARTGTPRQG